jgi:hypothetical protein
LEHEPISCEDGVRLDVRLLGEADIRCAGVPVKFAKRSTTLTLLALLVADKP